MSKYFRGIMVPVMTPFMENGDIDQAAYKKHVRFLVDSGVDSLLVPSGTGEFANLTTEDKVLLVKLTAEEVKGEVPIVALASDCSLKNVMNLCSLFKNAGATELMLTAPYYSYVNQRALINMYTYVADNAGLPLWIYHQPGETKMVIEPDTVKELSKHPNIVGIKIAAGENFLYFCEITRLFRDDSEFSILMGEDFATLPSYVVGGDGSVSSLANVVPKAFVDIWQSYCANDLKKCEALQRDIQDYFDCFVMVETGAYQSSCKSILREMGYYPTNKVSAPFVEVLPEEEERILKDAKALKVL